MAKDYAKVTSKGSGKNKNSSTRNKAHSKSRYNTSAHGVSDRHQFSPNAMLFVMTGVIAILVIGVLALNKLHLVPKPRQQLTPTLVVKTPPPSSSPSAKTTTLAHLSETAISPNLSSATHRTTVKRPRFDFYNILPNAHVPTSTPADSTAKKVIPRRRYQLQIASFRDYTDADHLRAKLISEGLNTHLESITTGGNHWYRVMAGPYDSFVEAELDQTHLKKDKHIDSLLLSVKKPST